MPLLSSAPLHAQLERALELSADMQRRGIPRNVHTHSALMNVCIKCGQLRAALDAWEDMRRDGCAPNVVRRLFWPERSARCTLTTHFTAWMAV